MLASGMDEATAYQYLQQLCGAGAAGKGSKPKLTLFIISFPPQSSKCYQLYPCFKQHTRPPITKAFLFTNTCQRKGDKPRPYICVLIHLLLLPALYFNSEQPFQFSPPPPCLSELLQKPSATREEPSVSEPPRNRWRMQRKYSTHLTAPSKSTRTDRRLRFPSVSFSPASQSQL